MGYENNPNYVDETPGKKFYCTCGESSTKPHCDGSHEKLDTGKSPVEFEVSEKERMAICDCGQSNNMPFCDGAHTKL
jgi:CDGSH-type Zn-finger protein